MGCKTFNPFNNTLNPLGRILQQGFTLIEIMISIAIIAIFLGIGIPAIGDWIQNRQVNVLAESIGNGLRTAQAEAVQRNAPVDMVFTTSDVTVFIPADATNAADPTAVTLTSGGLAIADRSPNWLVRVNGVTTGAGFIQGKMAQDGSENARFSGPAGVSFSPLGRLNASIAANGAMTVPAGNVVFRVLNPSVKSNLANLRCVFVGIGGAVRICDPRATTPDARACVPPLASTDCPIP